MPALIGPEKPTFMENQIRRTGLSYGAGCILVGCLLGAPGFYLVYLLDSLDPAKALNELSTSAFFAVGQFGQPLPLGQGLAVAGLYTIFLTLTLYFVRYMRLGLLEVEKGVVRLLPSFTEEEYHRTFGGVANVGNVKYVVLMAIGFSIIYVPPRLARDTRPFLIFSDVVMIPLGFLVIGAGLWVYLRSLWGVYRFGSRPLQLVPFYQERMLGLHPIGHMTLSFGVVYLILDTLALAAGVLTADLLDLLILSGLLVLLAVMLFFPVYGMHQKMREVKANERAVLRAKVAEIAASSEDGGRKNEEAAMNDVRYLLVYRTLSAEAGKIPTWPFETGRLERFLAVFLSVTAIILARLIQLAFKF